MRVACRSVVLGAFAMLALTRAAVAQDWMKTYVPDTGVALAAAATPDGGFAVVGLVKTGSGFLEADAFLLKLTALGDVEWAVALGGADYEEFSGVVALPTGYLVAGRTWPPGGMRLIAARFDLSGNIVWQNDYGAMVGVIPAAAASSDGAWFVSSTTDASPEQSVSVMKLATDGSVLWHRGVDEADGSASRIGGPVPIAPTDTGGVVLAKTAWRSAKPAFLPQLVSFAQDGAVEWMHEVSAGLDTYYPEDLKRLADGSLVLVGYDGDGLNRSAAWVVKTDAMGVPQWRSRHGVGGNRDQAWAVAPLPSGELLVSEVTIAASGIGTGRLTRLDASGAIVSAWAPLPMDAATDLVAIPGGVLAAGGTPIGEVAVARLDASGMSSAPCASPAVVRLGTLTPVTGDSVVAQAVYTIPTTPTPTALPVRALAWSATCGGCAPLECLEVTITPPLPCPGDTVTLELHVQGGEGTVAVAWDLDGDGDADDATGDTIMTTAPQGAWHVVATATDACPMGPQSCSSRLDLVLPSPLGEVSDVFSGAPPLRVPSRDAVDFEGPPGATAYNLNVGVIGTWYDSTPATGERCAVTAWSNNGDGTVRVSDPFPASGSYWLVVTAANRCFEGGAGSSSRGVARDGHPTWSPCGPGG